MTLKYDSGSVKGKDFKFAVGRNILSFGLVVALAGDFYANYSRLPHVEVEQISDNWATDPESSIRLALSLAKSLSTDAEGYLGPVLTLIGDQKTEVDAGIKAGRDVAQVRSPSSLFLFDHV